MKRLLILSTACLLFSACQTAPIDATPAKRTTEPSKPKQAAGDKFYADLKKWNDTKREYLAQNPGLKPEVAKAIRESGLTIGMTKYEVTLSWLDPDRTNTSVSAGGQREQCVWDFGREPSWMADLMKDYGPTNWFSGRYYLYFDKGILESWQKSQ